MSALHHIVIMAMKRGLVGLATEHMRIWEAVGVSLENGCLSQITVPTVISSDHIGPTNVFTRESVSSIVMRINEGRAMPSPEIEP